MRHLGLLPWVGILKPTDKIPIGSYIEDIEEMLKYNVLSTPVLMIDEVAKIKGRVPDINEIKQLLKP